MTAAERGHARGLEMREARARLVQHHAALAAGAPTAFDLAFSALVELVELRARKLYPEKFADPPAGSPSPTATEE